MAPLEIFISLHCIIHIGLGLYGMESNWIAKPSIIPEWPAERIHPIVLNEFRRKIKIQAWSTHNFRANPQKGERGTPRDESSVDLPLQKNSENSKLTSILHLLQIRGLDKPIFVPYDHSWRF